MSRANTQRCKVCDCRFGDTDCFHFLGQGTTDDPYVVETTLDSDTDNLIECGPTGFGVFLPPIYRDRPSCRIFSVQPQHIGWGALQVLFFEREHYDTDSMHNTEDDLGTIHINTTGIYTVNLSVMWLKPKTNITTGTFAAYIRKNGIQFLAVDTIALPNPDSYPRHSMAVQEFFEAGDYLHAMVLHTMEKKDGIGVNGRIIPEQMSPVFGATLLRKAP